MKCQNCTCLVSSDFKHAIQTNCCPKCGKTIMGENVQVLYTRMQKVLSEEGNDLGDLAVWFVRNYLTKSNTAEQISTQSEDTKVDAEILQETEVKQITPFHKTTQDRKLLTTDRTSLFAKRAGVDKIKFETLVKDIQGVGSEDQFMGTEGSEDFDLNNETYEFNNVPLSKGEMRQMSGLFNMPNDEINFSELQKLQKLEQLATTGSVGKIRRSS